MSFQPLKISQGSDGYVTFFNGVSSIAGDNDLYWDRYNNRLGIRTTSPVSALTINDAISLGETSDPDTDSGYGKIYVSSSDSNLYFKNSSGSTLKISTSVDIKNYDDQWLAQYNFNNDVLEALDGYSTSAGGGINYDDQWLAQYNFNNDVLEALDGYSSGSGDVTKVGTPVDSQVGVWTGDGTIEGVSDLTWDGTDFIISKDQNNRTALRVYNNDTGTAAYSRIQLTGNSITTQLASYGSGSSMTVFGESAASGTVLQSTSSSGLFFYSDGTAKMRFGTGGSLAANLAMTIDSSQRIGIGTDSPNTILDIQSTDPQLSITDTNTTDNQTLIKLGGSNSSVYSTIGTSTFRAYRNGGSGVNMAIGMLSSDTGWTGSGGNIVFVTEKTDGTAITPLYVSRDGNVGVGTTGPNNTLEVAGNFAVTNAGIVEYITRTTTSSTAVSAVAAYTASSTSSSISDGFGGNHLLRVGDSGATNTVGLLKWARDGADNSGKISLVSYNAGSANGYLVLDSGGNVGIGTENPDSQAKLHVSKDNGSVPALTSATVAVFNNSSAVSDSALIQVISGNTGVSGLTLGDTDNGVMGYIRYDNNIDQMEIKTAGTTSIYIDSSQNVGVGVTPNERLTVEGAMSLDEISAPSNTSGYGKLYVKSSDSKLYFKTSGGTEYDLTATGSGGGTNYDDRVEALETSRVDILEALDGYVYNTWTEIIDETIGFGTTVIAHGLGSTPTELVVISDDAPVVDFEVYRSTDVSANTGAWTNMAGNTNGWDQISHDISSDIVTSSGDTKGALLCPVLGIYELSCTFVISSLSDGKLIKPRLGSSIDSGSSWGTLRESYQVLTGSANWSGGIIQARVNVTTSDLLITPGVYHDQGAARNIESGINRSRFYGKLCRDWYWTADATNITIYSCCARTMSFRVKV